MAPDVQELQTGAPVVFHHDGQRKHGTLITAGPLVTFVWDSPSNPCVQVGTNDVEQDEAAVKRGDHPGAYNAERRFHAEREGEHDRDSN